MELTDAELEELYTRYAPVLLHRCRRITRNEEDAHDAVHETFARVIRHAETFRQQSSPLTWMYRISTNYCLNQLRNKKSRTAKHEAHKVDIVGEGFTTASDESSEDHERIMALLDGVDEQTRRCVIHTYFDGCTRQQTADLVGISVPTVRKRVSTFLDHARSALAVACALFLLGSLP